MRLSSKTLWALSVTGPKLSTAMVTGPMPRKPNAIRPKAKIGAAKSRYASGIRSVRSALPLSFHPAAMSTRMRRPVQKALKLPATKPERMLRLAPPCAEALVTSFTCLLEVLVNTLVNSGISAPAAVPRLMIEARIHQSSFSSLPP